VKFLFLALGVSVWLRFYLFIVIGPNLLTVFINVEGIQRVHTGIQKASSILRQ